MESHSCKRKRFTDFYWFISYFLSVKYLHYIWYNFSTMHSVAVGSKNFVRSLLLWNQIQEVIPKLSISRLVGGLLAELTYSILVARNSKNSLIGGRDFWDAAFGYARQLLSANGDSKTRLTSHQFDEKGKRNGLEKAKKVAFKKGEWFQVVCARSVVSPRGK